MLKLDDKAILTCRERAMNAALATHESQPQRSADETVATAEKYFAFLTADIITAEPMIVALRLPSGLPGDVVPN
jgi:hypothetical protein